MSQPIISRRKGNFLHVQFNRPDSGNMMQSADLALLTKAIAGVKSEGGVKAVLISGKGDDFTLGRDPGPQSKSGKKSSKKAPAKTAWEVHRDVTSQILGVYSAVRHCPVPVIAKVQGHAQGFGSGLVGACDLAYAADTAIFSTPEMHHGIAPTLVISALASVNRKMFADMVYSGDPIDADTALAVGLVSRVVDAPELDEAVDRLLEQLDSYDPLAIEVIKGFLSRPGHMDPDALSDLADFTLSTAFTRPR